MKRVGSIILLSLMAVLTSCNKDGLIERDNKEAVGTKSKVIAKIDRIDFRVNTEPFEFVDIDGNVSKDELRGEANKISLTSKGDDVKPYVSISKDDMMHPVYGRVVGAGDQYLFTVSQEADGNRRSAYKLTTGADGKQNLFIGYHDPVDRTWFFKENQYLCMFYNGEIYITQNYYDHANEGLCLVKNKQLNKRQIPFLTDLKKVELHTISGNGGDSPNTATFNDTFKPRGSLIAMRLINEVGEEITVRKIKFLQPHAIAYEGYFDINDITKNTGPGKTYNADRMAVPFVPRPMDRTYEYPVYAQPESSDNLTLPANTPTDGRIYVWGHPINGKEAEPVIAQFEYTKASKGDRIYLSIPQKITPKTSWESTKAYRCNFKIKAEFDYSNIFADELRTELITGVTAERIEQMPDDVWKEVAKKLLSNTYTEAEFRVGNYKAYPNPWERANSNKTNPYSLMDNPTGIEVKAGDVLELMVGDFNTADFVVLRVQNLDKPDGDGFNGSPEYRLVKGLNKITMKSDGLIYLRYQTSDYATAQSRAKLKLHFANGVVNGYFDSQNPKHTGRADELLAAASGKYFDLVGQYAHLTMPTQDFRDKTQDLKKLIDDFDRLVKGEMELLGLFKYDKVFNNRMYFNVMYGSFMYATYYHTAYAVNTINDLLNNDQFSSPTGGAWGPAHEVGHMNQTSKGMRWCGLMEVTNNIMSEYITTTIFGQKSRIQTEDIEWGNNRYTKAWNSLLVHKIPFSYGSNIYKKDHSFADGMPENVKKYTTGDVFCQLVPFWQVQLYFGNVLGETPDKRADKGGFYPDVYEHVRVNEPVGSIPGDDKKNGLHQTELPYVMSKASGYDLTDFFEKWGFLSPINTIVYSYATEPLVVTQDRIDEVKQRIKALGLPKPPVPLEYITDKTVDLFKSNAAIVQGGNAYWSGIDLRIPDWQNVVVYEIWDKPYGTAGARLMYVCDGYDATNENSTNAKCAVARNYLDRFISASDPYYVYAVGVDNSRVLVPFN